MSGAVGGIEKLVPPYRAQVRRDHLRGVRFPSERLVDDPIGIRAGILRALRLSTLAATCGNRLPVGLDFLCVPAPDQVHRDDMGGRGKPTLIVESHEGRQIGTKWRA